MPRLQLQLLDIVQHMDRHFVHLEVGGIGDGARPAAAIVVAAHCGHRGELAQRLEYARVSDVAGMHDVVGSAQILQRFRAHQPVSIRNQSYPRHITRAACSDFR